ncbi:MAG: flagellar protein FlgN [Deltaproteobacteria bacterium]|nr:flagellar protein FlgN [Deltaproteobacteria bacterium]MBW1737241.1 flagellar protein FlgN [Deltaproteobacteria bacterium]MBW1908145.1 flagellar protein FlgN [Deltaproteobacteria bacterium]MBW2032224.1 flagellar protein FlgN [Deltaproteobacteria bacterium]MBW2113798.1 flagellar protein FlgN [Deltaproteobacteria bacterium]
MDLLLNKLLGLLEEETGFYRSLLSVLQKEKKAVVDSKLDELNEAGKEKESLLLKIRILEEERLRIQERLADSLGYEPQGLTLTKLSQLVGEPYSTRLKVCYSNLLTLIPGIREINHSNKSLLTHSLELVRGSLALLNNFVASNAVYYRTGKMQSGDQSGNVLSGEV